MKLAEDLPLLVDLYLAEYSTEDSVPAIFHVPSLD